MKTVTVTETSGTAGGFNSRGQALEIWAGLGRAQERGEWPRGEAGARAGGGSRLQPLLPELSRPRCVALDRPEQVFDVNSK